jgi:hypothetical protein
MAEKRKQGYFAKHAKSSAAMVSVAVHAGIIVVALFFVAVTVTQKSEVDFEAKPVNRPRMNLRRLQVPVNVRKPVQQPKLRKTIVVKPNINQVTPDIRMPEIVGVKGGIGAGSGGFGAGAGLGFSMPEINIFGVRSKGEKVYIMLDASNEMMYDEMGGIPAYSIIKDELVRILGELPPTALFNVAVFDNWRTYQIFPNLVPANSANVSKVAAWLQPLNSVRPGMGADEWGPATLGPGGKPNNDDFITEKFRRIELWHRPAMLAMQQQADTLFVLTSWWGYQRFATEERDDAWLESSSGKRYLEKAAEALALYDQECRDRIANGQAPRVLNRHDKRLLVVTYFPDAELPPEPEYYYHKPEEYIKAMLELRAQYKPKTLGLRSAKNGQEEFTFNVIRFVRTEENSDSFRSRVSNANFKKMTGYFRGDYREIAGLEAIQSSVGGK